jgi:hypothetical protein
MGDKNAPLQWSYGEDNDGGYIEFNGEQTVWALNEGSARRSAACLNVCNLASAEYLEGLHQGLVIRGLPLDKFIEQLNQQMDVMTSQCATLLVTLKETAALLGKSCTASEIMLARHEAETVIASAMEALDSKNPSSPDL